MDGSVDGFTHPDRYIATGLLDITVLDARIYIDPLITLSGRPAKYQPWSREGLCKRIDIAILCLILETQKEENCTYNGKGCDGAHSSASSPPHVDREEN